jgi:hypothetical protein
MTGLSDVSLLFGQHVWEIERAREMFTTETRNFVSSILESIRRARPDPWSTARVRITIQQEIENESKVTGYLRSQYAIGRANIRFKKGTNFIVIADLQFGFSCKEGSEAFTWQINVVPAARYPQLDDTLWRSWRSLASATLPGAVHESKANTLCVCSRPLNPELTPEVAFTDVKAVFDFILAADDALAEAVGLDLSPGEDAAASPVAVPQ